MPKVLAAFVFLLIIVAMSHDQHPAGGGEARALSLKRGTLFKILFN